MPRSTRMSNFGSTMPLVVLVLFGSLPARSEETNLDEMQKKLDQARKEQAARDKASTKKKEAPAALPPPAAALPSGQQSVLVVTSDAACRLMADGDVKGE